MVDTIIPQTVSKRWSFHGYDFMVALKRNKDAFKLTASALVGFNSYIIASSGFNWKGFLISIAIALASLAGKLLVDMIDFLASDVEIKKE